MKSKALVAILLSVVLVASSQAETLKTTKKKKVTTEQTAPQETVIETPPKTEEVIVTKPAPLSAYDPGRNFNLRINPLNFVLTRFGVDFDIKLASWLTLGPSVSIGAPKLVYETFTTFTLGARANIYLNGNAIANSFYIGPSVAFENWGGSYGGSFNSFLIASTIGYHWVFDSGFNMMLGAGAVVAVGGSSSYNGETNGVSSFVTGVLPTVEFTLGWAF